MKIRSAFAGLILSIASANAMAAVAACGSTTSWGGLGPPGLEAFGQSFTAPGTYTDCYTFSLSAPALSFGGLIEIDPLLNKLDIDVTSISLFAGNALVDDSIVHPLMFAFSDLAGGLSAPIYTLAIESVVTTDPGWRIKHVGYAGTIVTAGTPVPEPGSMALFVATLLILAIARRRQQN